MALPTNRANETAQHDAHPADHNNVNDAVNILVAQMASFDQRLHDVVAQVAGIFRGETGATGQPGKTGPAGPRGATGPQGPPGPAGGGTGGGSVEGAVTRVYAHADSYKKSTMVKVGSIWYMANKDTSNPPPGGLDPS